MYNGETASSVGSGIPCKGGGKSAIDILRPAHYGWFVLIGALYFVRFKEFSVIGREIHRILVARVYNLKTGVR